MSYYQSYNLRARAFRTFTWFVTGNKNEIAVMPIAKEKEGYALPSFSCFKRILLWIS